MASPTAHLVDTRLAMQENNSDNSAKTFLLENKIGEEPGTIADFVVPSVWKDVLLIHTNLHPIKAAVEGEIKAVEGLVSETSFSKRIFAASTTASNQ